MIADPKYNHSNKNRALMDVSSIFEGEEPRLIDEWQEVPTIWDATRFEVDKSSKKGRLILTGSSTPVKDKIIHSGAGRIGSLKMRTMSSYEMGTSDGRVSLQSLFDSTFSNSFSDEHKFPTIQYYPLRGFITFLIRFPRVYGVETQFAHPEAWSPIGRFYNYVLYYRLFLTAKMGA